MWHVKRRIAGSIITYAESGRTVAYFLANPIKTHIKIAVEWR